MNQTIKTTPTMSIAFIEAGWHSDIVEQCRKSFLAELTQQGHDADQVMLFRVPGSLEIPLFAKKLAQSGRYNAIVAAGLIVDGGIYRHEFVASAVLDGIMRVQLDCDVPVLSAVLTPHNFQEHEPHMNFFADHFVIKGKEAAAACIATVKAHRLLAQIEMAA